MTAHDDKLAHIVDQLRAHRGQRPLSLHKRSVSHQVLKGSNSANAHRLRAPRDPRKRCGRDAGARARALARFVKNHEA